MKVAQRPAAVNYVPPILNAFIHSSHTLGARKSCICHAYENYPGYTLRCAKGNDVANPFRILTSLARHKSLILHTYEKDGVPSCRKANPNDPFQLQRAIALWSSQAQDCLWAKLSFGNISTLFGV